METIRHTSARWCMALENRFSLVEVARTEVHGVAASFLKDMCELHGAIFETVADNVVASLTTCRLRELLLVQIPMLPRSFDDAVAGGCPNAVQVDMIDLLSLD